MLVGRKFTQIWAQIDRLLNVETSSRFDLNAVGRNISTEHMRWGEGVRDITNLAPRAQIGPLKVRFAFASEIAHLLTTNLLAECHQTGDPESLPKLQRSWLQLITFTTRRIYMKIASLIGAGNCCQGSSVLLCLSIRAHSACSNVSFASPTQVPSLLFTAASHLAENRFFSMGKWADWENGLSLGKHTAKKNGECYHYHRWPNSSWSCPEYHESLEALKLRGISLLAAVSEIQQLQRKHLKCFWQQLIWILRSSASSFLLTVESVFVLEKQIN